MAAGAEAPGGVAAGAVAVAGTAAGVAGGWAPAGKTNTAVSPSAIQGARRTSGHVGVRGRERSFMASLAEGTAYAFTHRPPER
ncbi:MAG: hypothetical protein AB7F89_27410, partial [Pirellulaceae bacterium]